MAEEMNPPQPFGPGNPPVNSVEENPSKPIPDPLNPPKGDDGPQGDTE